MRPSRVPAARRAAVMAIVIASCCSITACGSGTGETVGPGPTGSDGSPPSPDAPLDLDLTLAPAVATADACATGYTDVPLTPENNVERWLQPSLRACRAIALGAPDGRTVSWQILNAGPALWVVEGVPGWDQAGLNTSDAAVTLFRHATAGRAGGLALEPGQQATFRSAPTFTLRMTLDAGLQTAWETTSRLTSAVQDQAEEVVLSTLSPAGRATVVCAQSAYDIAGSATDADPQIAPTDALQAVFEAVASASDCSDAIDEARSEDSAAGRRATLTLDDLRVRTRPAGAAFERSGFSVFAARIARRVGVVFRG